MNFFLTKIGSLEERFGVFFGGKKDQMVSCLRSSGKNFARRFGLDAGFALLNLLD